MGKGRLAKIREKYGAPSKTMEERKTENIMDMEERKKKGIMDKTKQKIFTKMEAGYDDNTARTRAKQLNRWREMTGKGPNEAPDYTDPRVHLEFFLCDLKVQLLLTEGRRDEVLAMMDDQQR